MTATCSFNQHHQYPPSRLPSRRHHRHAFKAPLPFPKLPPARSSLSFKTGQALHSRYRRHTVSPHRHAALLFAASSPYRPKRLNLYSSPAASLQRTAAAAAAAAAAFSSWSRGNHETLLTSGIHNKLAFARSVMPPGERSRQPPSAVRTATRPPLTPKVASKSAPVLASLARKPQATVLSGSNTPKNDATTPVSAFLATNVTPRTGHRQTRVDSANSTPSATPNNDKISDGWDRDSPRPGPGGLGISTPSDGGHKSSEMHPDSTDSNKFFYASDVKNIHSSGLQPRQTPPIIQKGPTFFYAKTSSNDPLDRSAVNTPQSAPMLSPSSVNVQDPISTKFFYANGTPDLESKTSFLGPNSASASCVGVRSPASNRPPLGSCATVVGSAQRPTSPLKNNQISAPVLSPILRPAMPPSCSSQTHQTSSPAATTDIPRGIRRVSIEAPSKNPRRHSQTGINSAVELQMPPKQTVSPNPSDSVPPPASPRALQTTMTMASLLHAAEEVETEDEGGPLSEPQSPSKSHMSDSVKELVANARRERKVQDLEITNASLEAINRTLERQLRKQTAELRRYRRLSRSGRLSLASVPNSRVVSEALTDPPVDLSDLSETEVTEEEEEEDEEDDSAGESDVSMADAASMSAISLGSVRRKRDEKRLQLDLTKHQELLIDSQKMNQSIKRCLNWSETLIKEGQRALQYHVRVSDVEFGGRVLAPVDEEEDYDVSVEDFDEHDASIKEPGSSSSPARPLPDRDSGIELPPGDDGS